MSFVTTLSFSWCVLYIKFFYWIDIIVLIQVFRTSFFISLVCFNYYFGSTYAKSVLHYVSYLLLIGLQKEPLNAIESTYGWFTCYCLSIWNAKSTLGRFTAIWIFCNTKMLKRVPCFWICSLPLACDK